MSDKEMFELLSMDVALSPREKELRDRYVDEFFKDFDWVAAAIRVGYPKAIAVTYAQTFMEEPYVRRAISEREKALASDPKKEEAETRRQIRNRLLAEANYHGPGASHAARVSALAKLASILDMDAPTKIKNETTHRGGVMMIPVAAQSEDDWETLATQQQEELIRNARDRPN